MQNPQISIIVPIYKVEKELPRCLESLLKQTYKEIEIILIDDGSPDSCPQLCDEYAKTCKYTRVIHKSNGGLSDARNAGLKNAKGNYVMFVDSDDYIEANACKKFAGIAKQYAPDIIVGEARQINKQKKTEMDHPNLEENKVYSSREYIILTALNGEWYAPTWLNVYRKDYLLEKQLFFVKGLLHEDMEMLPRVFLSAGKILYCKGYFYNYVVREGSIMQQKNIKKREDMKKIYTTWKLTFDSINDDQLRRVLNAFLCRCYLRTCRECKITGTYVNGVTKKFLLKNSLGWMNVAKTILYVFFPHIYFSIKRD